MSRSQFVLPLLLLLPPFLHGAPVPQAEEDIARLIRQLGSDAFEMREAASKKLEELGAAAWEPLRQAAVSSTDAEIRSRARDLVERITRRLFGEASRFTGHEGQVNAIAVSGDGKRLLNSGLDATLRLWDVQTGKELRKLAGLQGSVRGLALDKTGKQAFFNVGMGWGDKDWVPATDFTIQVWDTERDQIVRRLNGHTGEIKSLSLSPDGRRLISAGRDRIIRMWDVETGKERLSFKGHTDGVRRAIFTPDGRRILSASKDKTVRVWDAQTGKELARFTGHTDDVLGVAVTSDGKQAVSVGADTVVRHWDVETAKELHRMEGHTTVLWSAGISPAARLAVSGGGAVVRTEGFYRSAGMDFEPRLWDLSTGREIHRLEGHTNTTMSVLFAPDGRHVFTCSSDRTIRRWRTDWPGRK